MVPEELRHDVEERLIKFGYADEHAKEMVRRALLYAPAGIKFTDLVELSLKHA